MSETKREGRDYPGNFLRQRLWSAAFDADRDGLSVDQIIKEFAEVMADIPTTFPAKTRQSHHDYHTGG